MLTEREKVLLMWGYCEGVEEMTYNEVEMEKEGAMERHLPKAKEFVDGISEEYVTAFEYTSSIMEK